MRTRIAVVLLFLLAAAPASGQGQPVRLRSAYSTIGIGHSLVWVAKESGAFKENGIDLQLLFIGSSTTATQAVLAGDIPLAIMAGGAAISSALSGSDLVMLASLKKDPSQAYLAVAKNITSAAQLRGKKLGVSRLGSASDFLLKYILKKLGLTPADVTIVQVGNSPLRMAALANGAIDGAALSYEEMSVAKRMGFTILLDVSALGIEGLTSDVVTTRRYARESRDVALRYIKSFARGLSVYLKNKKFTMDVIAKYTRSEDREKIEIGYEHFAKTFLKKPYPAMGGVQLALEEIGERTPAAKSARPEQFVDNSLVKELDDSGYFDALYK
jgi:NitT/TauT family transport system substrate-binding protein